MAVIEPLKESGASTIFIGFTELGLAKRLRIDGPQPRSYLKPDIPANSSQQLQQLQQLLRHNHLLRLMDRRTFFLVVNIRLGRQCQSWP
jgi:hypothetical protein